MARRLFFVEEVRGGRTRITGDDAHHLTRVLRVEAGQRYEISDNRNVYLAEVENARKSEVSFTVVEKLSAPEPVVQVDLIAALIRLERFEWIIEKATELGVACIHPFLAERSEKGLGLAAAKRMERWQRIAREASEQSRRVRLPEVCEPIDGVPVLLPDFKCRFMLDELPGTRPILRALPSERKVEDRIAVLTGPEGGWTDRERSRLEDGGWERVSLGPGILRAETAAIAALAILNAAWHRG